MSESIAKQLINAPLKIEDKKSIAILAQKLSSADKFCAIIKEKQHFLKARQPELAKDLVKTDKSVAPAIAAEDNMDVLPEHLLPAILVQPALITWDHLPAATGDHLQEAMGIEVCASATEPTNSAITIAAANILDTITSEKTSVKIEDNEPFCSLPVQKTLPQPVEELIAPPKLSKTGNETIELAQKAVPQSAPMAANNFVKEDIAFLVQPSIKEIMQPVANINDTTPQVVTTAESSTPSGQSVLQQFAIGLNSSVILADQTKQGQNILASISKNIQEGLETNTKQLEETSVYRGGFSIKGQEQESPKNMHDQGGFRQQTDGEGNSTEMLQSPFNKSVLHSFSTDKQGPPKPDVQVFSAVKGMINTINNAGKKEITINLFPETLGPVRVEILSVMTDGKAKAIQSIKIIVENKETLEILEKFRIDLEKSLKEVASTQADSALQFEMGHQSGSKHGGSYFGSIEERDNWMNNFIHQDSVSQQSLGQGPDAPCDVRDSGYITEDSVNIRV